MEINEWLVNAPLQRWTKMLVKLHCKRCLTIQKVASAPQRKLQYEIFQAKVGRHAGCLQWK